MNKQQDAIRDQIYLAALLHDIGKFYQRAKDKTQKLSPEVVGVSDYACPENQKGYLTHQHVLWTYQFFLIDEVRLKFRDLGFTPPASSQKTDDNLINLALYHHRPQTLNQAVIQLADWWSSGMDRNENGELAMPEINYGKGKYKKVPLINIFSKLWIKNQQAEQVSKFKLLPLSLSSDTILPEPLAQDNINLESDYSDLWDGFIRDFVLLPGDSVGGFTNSLVYLLKQYLWCIPASTVDLPDHSLFDHLKTTAAFAICLYDYFIENSKNPYIFDNQKHRVSVQEGFYPIRFVCLDLSGIQRYLYDITGKGAAKSLRGRSFSLQIMIERAAIKLMNKLSLYQGNIVYSSGGKFYALVPNTTFTSEQLKEFYMDLAERSWAEFKVSPYFCLGSVSFSFLINDKNTGNNILIENHQDPTSLKTLWQILSDQIQKSKKRKFSDSEGFKQTMFDKLFTPFEKGGNIDICSVTGEEGALVSIGDKELSVSKSVAQQIELGEALPNHRYIIHGESFKNHFNLLNYDFLVCDSQYRYPIDGSTILTTPQSDESKIDFLTGLTGNRLIYGFRFFGGSRYPMRHNRIATFEELAGEENGSAKKSFTRLGVLRMDVDSLGQIFIEGFKPEETSFTAFSTLSGMLDLFFSGYLNTRRDSQKYKDHVAIIYSGGDDVFAVGRWDLIIDFADEVRSEFRKFVGRDDITISAGIEIIDPKFPIRKAAFMALEAEHKAKNNKFGSIQKDSICLFGTPISWNPKNGEWSNVKRWKDDMVKWIESGELTKGFLMKFFKYYTMFLDANNPDNEKSNTNEYRWKWLALYDISRRLDSTSPSKIEILKKFKILIFNEINNKNFPFASFITACYWAELIVRTNKTNKS